MLGILGIFPNQGMLGFVGRAHFYLFAALCVVVPPEYAGWHLGQTGDCDTFKYHGPRVYYHCLGFGAVFGD